MPAPNEITHADLLPLIGTPDCPLIIDVSIDADVAEDPFLIPGAVRHPHTDALDLTEALDGRRAVVVCQKGKKLSQGMTSRLRGEGIDAYYLHGGNYGWRDTDAPRIPLAALPAPVDGATLWVASERPDANTLAAAWLVLRFADAAARFLFVGSDEIAGVADKYSATPLGDFEGTCERFALTTPSLNRISTRLEDETLTTLFTGFKGLHSDDHALLTATLPLFDALSHIGSNT